MLRDVVPGGGLLDDQRFKVLSFIILRIDNFKTIEAEGKLPRGEA
jgi:hypothetical protein